MGGLYLIRANYLNESANGALKVSLGQRPRFSVQTILSPEGAAQAKPLGVSSGLGLSCNTYPGRCPGIALAAPLALKTTAPLAVPDPLAAPWRQKRLAVLALKARPKLAWGNAPGRAKGPRNGETPQEWATPQIEP